MRLYPEQIPPFDGEPLKDQFVVINDWVYGQQIITLSPIKSGERVFAFTGTAGHRVTLHSLQRGDIHIHDPWAMGYVIHSCDPNMTCDMETMTFTATKMIKAFEVLTMDYNQTETALFRSFKCQCGSPNCRGIIK